MDYGRGEGVAALTLAVVAIFIPVAGVFVAWLALLLAADAYRHREDALASGALAVSTVNLFFLSPSVWLASAFASTNFVFYGSVLMVAIPTAVALWMQARTGLRVERRD